MNVDDPIFVKPTCVWVSRDIEMTDEEIRAIVGNPEVQVVRYGDVRHLTVHTDGDAQ